MVKFKCKMCGGIIEVEEGKSTCECDFCGTMQTIPTIINNAKLTSLHNRANTLRLKNEFDKAMLTYENIINENPNDAEAHWGLLLCRYGIEYVDDAKTGKKIPTCHRTQIKSIFDDIDYKAAIENSDVVAKRLYQEEAEEIDKIQKGILAVSLNEEPYDIFICYKEKDENNNRTKDSVIAQEIYNELIKRNYRVFFARITLESKLGVQYEPYIYSALTTSKVMIVVGSKVEYFNAVWVKNEWSRFIGMMNESANKKYIIPCYKDIDAYELPNELLSFQAQDINKIGFIQDLTRGIDKIFNKDEKKKKIKVSQPIYQNGINIQALVERSEILIGDGEYEKASKLLDEVLNNDPRNAKAYILLLLIELKLKDESELGDYPSLLTNYKNYNNALKFADKDYKEKLEHYNQNIINKENDENCKNIYSQAIKFIISKQYMKAIEKLSLIANYKDSKELIEKCKMQMTENKISNWYNEVLELIKKSKYEEAISKINSMKDYDGINELKEKLNNAILENKEKNYQKAIELINKYQYESANAFLDTLNGYKDSESLVIKSIQLMSKEKTYQHAKSYFDDNTIDSFQKAQAELSTILDYRDSKELLQKAKNSIDKIYNDKKIKNDKLKLKIKIITPVVVFIVIMIVLTCTLFVPLGKYNKGLNYIKSKQFDVAEIIFNELGDFKDAKEQIDIINSYRAFENSNYEKGIEYICKASGVVNVYYDGNSGIPDVEYEEVSSMNNDWNACNAKKENFDFGGWNLINYSIENANNVYSANVYLSAIWKNHKYSIVYDLDGGVNSYYNPQYFTYEDTIEIKEPSKTGYIFLGWYDGEKTYTKYLVSKRNNDLSLTAKWKEKSYNIEIDPDGGIYLEDNHISINYNSNFDIKSPSKEGYKFVGWYYNNKKINSGEKWKIDKNETIILKAKYEPIHYKITYEMNGGENDSSNPLQFTCEDVIEIIEPNNRYGYTFLGWYDGEKIYKNYLISNKYNDIYLEAKWEEKSYTIKIDSNGGLYDGDRLITIKYNSILDLSYPTKKGCNFIGWYSGELKIDSGEKWKIDSDEVILLTAMWESECLNYLKYTITNNQITINGFKDDYYGQTLVIPSKINGLIVSEILPNSFLNAKDITYAEIPATIASIGVGAFSGMDKVEKIVLPFVGTGKYYSYSSREKLLGAIFGKKEYDEDVEINPNTKQCYYYDNMLWSEYWYIPETLKEVQIVSATELASGAFSNCKNIEKITISEGCKQIGSYAFYGCTSLKIYFEADTIPSNCASDWNPNNVPFICGYKTYNYIS